MTILVTGATGLVGRHVTEHLVARGADVRAFVRDPGAAGLPAGVSLAKGDFLDINAVKTALDGVTTLFLLNAVVPDELTQALVALDLARKAGIRRVVYLSVFHGERYIDVPHFAGKLAVERMIEETGIPATILRPAYYMNNDLLIRDVVTDHGVYPMPIGGRGLAMIDARDIAEIAAIELLRRERSDEALPLDRINLVGPDVLTAADAAAVWSEILGREIVYPGEDLDSFEAAQRHVMPPWMAHDMRLMAERFGTEGMLSEPGDVARLTDLLGRPLRTYRAFVREIAAA